MQTNNNKKMKYPSPSPTPQQQRDQPFEYRCDEKMSEKNEGLQEVVEPLDEDAAAAALITDHSDEDMLIRLARNEKSTVKLEQKEAEEEETGEEDEEEDDMNEDEKEEERKENARLDNGEEGDMEEVEENKKSEKERANPQGATTGPSPHVTIVENGNIAPPNSPLSTPFAACNPPLCWVDLIEMCEEQQQQQQSDWNIDIPIAGEKGEQEAEKEQEQPQYTHIPLLDYLRQ